MKLAPIVLFVYNRPWHTEQTVQALQNNALANESELFIYSDEAKNKDSRNSVDKVRKYVDSIDGFKKVTVVKREKNFGLANSIIEGVTKIVNKYGRIIVLEDDLITSTNFLKFMNEALELYKNESMVASIHGYVYPIEGLPDTFFIRGADCWGWATWKRAWDLFEEDGQKLLDELKSKKIEKEADFNSSYDFTKMLKDQIKGKNDSWAIRWYMSVFLKDNLTLYPGKSYVQNIGHDNQGTHCTSETNMFKIILNNDVNNDKIEILEDLDSRKKIENFFKSIRVNIFQRITLKFLRLIK